MPYIKKLIESCNKAREAKPLAEFTILHDSDFTELADIKKAIYIIEEVGGDNSKTFLEFKVYKETKQRACPKLNAPSKVMYVGSSTTGLKSRIKQHIGCGHKKTYALNLKHWFKGKYKITVKVFDEEKDVLQIIEDALSYDLAPAFGKQGANNK